MTTDEITVSPATLAATLAAEAGSLFALVRVVSLGELDVVAAAVQANIDALAERGVGLVIVSDDREVRDVVCAHAGTLPFPITALADPGDARGWLAGQRAVGATGVRPTGGSRTTGLSAALHNYICDHLNPPADPIAAQLAADTQRVFADVAGMNIGEDQGRLLTLLVQLTRAEHVVEVGTFTGMSALWLARGLRPGGRLTCFESWAEPLQLAREAWGRAGLEGQIDIVTGPAEDGLRALPHHPAIDLAFIDADKLNNTTYLDLILERLAPDGIVLVDNTLWNGAVADERNHDADTVHIRRFNDDIAARPDLDVVILSIGDGLTIIRRAPHVADATSPAARSSNP